MLAGFLHAGHDPQSRGKNGKGAIWWRQGPGYGAVAHRAGAAGKILAPGLLDKRFWVGVLPGHRLGHRPGAEALIAG